MMQAFLPMIKSLLRSRADRVRIWSGIAGYYMGRQVPASAREAVLRLHCETNGRFTESMAPLLRRLRPARATGATQGFLGALSPEKVKDIAGAIRRDGFYVFESRLPGALVDEVNAFVSGRPAFVPGYSKSPGERYVFDPAAPLGKKYAMAEDEIIQSGAIQQLMADPGFLAVAESYLQTEPMMADVTLWWSAVHAGSNSEDAGQNFHFDFDTPPGWLMFFFHLTDVDGTTGPHVFVRGSHKPGHPAAAELRRRGYARINDYEVENAFGKDSVIELHGKRGTILAVDTRGFHKGKALQHGSRLMAQLIFTFPQFAGAHVAKQQLPAQKHSSLVQAIARTPRLYQKFL